MIANDRVFNAYLDEVQMITVLLPYSYHGGNSSAFYLTDGNEKIQLRVNETFHLTDSLKYVCSSPMKPEIGKEYNIIDEHGGKTDLQIGAVIRTNEFDETFYYTGNDLGAKLQSSHTVFKVWAPTASQVQLKLAQDDNSTPIFKRMSRGEKGVWSIIVEEGLECYRYSYHVRINGEWREAVDPYANAVTINGRMGVVVDLEKTRVEQPDLPKLEDPCDVIIYETHIRDLTIHPASGVHHKGKFLGAAEVGTKSPSGTSTGLSYIKDLGVTHIEFLPFNDFAGVDERNPDKDYNWGYNPIHFNAPDGSYSTNPEEPYTRIAELKRLIAAVHAEGLRVVMDVVYNHVYIRESSSFEQIVPGYFFRHGDDGLPSNGTGVGNDFASERLMGRKFILDSVRYWLEEYGLDGFRFDLMGILDIDTMQAIRKMVDDINPSTIIIGEGWDLNTPIKDSQKATIGNQASLPNIGQFNDWFRDTIKGSTFNLYDRGYALGNERLTEAAKQVIAGSVGIGKRKNGLFLEPVQTVNYVECHDNHTLWDKLEACQQDHMKRRHRLATSLVILAQGIPFIHSGQEFFRTKQGIGNSYQSSDDINRIDWERRDAELENVQYIKGIIKIRRSHKAFRLPSTKLIREHIHFLPIPTPIIGYTLSEVGRFGKWNSILVLINPSTKRENYQFPQEENGWKILADHEYASDLPFREIEGETIDIEPCALVVAVR
ncbi:pullulanase [Mesobacillus persicus]|uniref:Pullulanase n=1 Tax=Mesobacillus persicus TaxID=930146 RepID=A0A1H7Y087_9BACI|nr:type I pullulanase [Mesobacillus persicus]SEM39383.1 pullulanase [Mesobacillus persicus]